MIEASSALTRYSSPSGPIAGPSGPLIPEARTLKSAGILVRSVVMGIR